MPERPLRFLLVEDTPLDAALVQHELRRSGFEPVVALVDNEPDFVSALAARPDVVLCDWSLPQFDALRALEIAHAHAPDTPFIIVSGSIGEEHAVQAIKLGATDYLLKDRLGRLGQAITQALAQRELRDAERRARDELRASEARYRALTECLPQIVWTARPDGTIGYYNPRMSEYTGYLDGDWANWDWAQIFHPDDQAKVAALWAEMLHSGVPRDIEFRLRRADGQYRWHIGRQTAVRGADGAVVQWVGTCTDIQDQRLAAEALARDARVLAAIRDSVVVTDPDGVVTYWNDGATRLFGWTADEMVGRPYSARFPESARAEPDRELRARAAGGEWNGEYEDYRKDGSRVWIDARVRRFDRPDGTPAGILGVSHDITARKQLELQLFQAQKMEAVGRLAGGVAHDFNNLLTVINGYADMLLSDAPEHDNEPLSAIREAGERASGLTSQLLAFSRKAIVSPRVLDLNEIIAHAERLLRRLIGEDILLMSSLCPTGCWIEADPTQLDQVILNLAVNARDAMPTGGRLTFTTNRVRRTGEPKIGEPRPGGYIELVVRDNGGGMSDEVKARLFEPFFTTKGPGKGTGLGLAVVHGVVNQAGGHISVESAVGAGTAFRILFPETAPPAGQTGSDLASARRGTETVLLVEDEEAVRTLCRVALESQGYTVLSANSGSQALRAVEEHRGPVDLLVTDVVMPGMSGRAVADAVRAKLPALRVLYVSGYTDDAVVRHGVREATDAFLQKPFTPLGLARKVRTVLDATG